MAQDYKLPHSIVFLIVLFLFPNVSLAAESLAIAGLIGKQISDNNIVDTLLPDAIRDEVVKSGKYELVSKETLAKSVKMLAPYREGCLDTQCMIDFGMLIDADYVIGGSISKENNQCFILLRLVKVRGENAGVLRSVSKQCAENPKDMEVTVRMVTAMFMGGNWADLEKEYKNIKAVEDAPPHDRIWKEPLTGMEFIWVEGGCFQMGCGQWIDNCEEDEKPSHKVCVDGFWMGKYEVTQGQWRNVMGDNPAKFQNGDEYPVEQMSFNNLSEFIAFLNERDRTTNGYRLPTEAEWEFAARSRGKEHEHAGGVSPENVAWYKTNSQGATHPVGTKTPNDIGMYDMTGNVYEWCSDWYRQDYYGSSVENMPKGPAQGKRKVIRGGSYHSELKNLRTTNRARTYPNCPNSTIGFRLVWSVEN